ncbi:MAG: polysaccharide deacetylase family protein [Planctomycetota bacterium]
MRACCLKIDVDTHEGMRDGVPRLLDALARAGLKATFFLSFGPDNAGKAIWNVLRKRGFLRKMLRTGAPSLYGWRTVLSGTLLPARPIAAAMPELVRRIEAEGHEVGVHAWDHRLWQDHLRGLRREQVAEQVSRACGAFEDILGRRPRSMAAPAWYATSVSLELQDARGLLYASDSRGGAPGFPVLDGYASSTLQIPTTQPCLEELLTLGERDLERCLDQVLAPGPELEPEQALVLPLHAEVEGGVYADFCAKLLGRIAASGAPVLTLEQHAEALLGRDPAPPRVPARQLELAGRSGEVLTLAAA